MKQPFAGWLRKLCMTDEGLPKNHGHELIAELMDVVSWLADGQSTPDDLRRTVVAFESRKLARFGFTLISALAADQTVLFSLRCAETGELCASMDVDPKTGAMTVQPAWA